MLLEIRSCVDEFQAGSFEREWLVSDLSAFQNATLLSRYIVVVGILIASYSSALGAIFGTYVFNE